MSSLWASCTRSWPTEHGKRRYTLIYIHKINGACWGQIHYQTSPIYSLAFIIVSKLASYLCAANATVSQMDAVWNMAGRTCNKWTMNKRIESNQTNTHLRPRCRGVHIKKHFRGLDKHAAHKSPRGAILLERERVRECDLVCVCRL